MATKTYLVSTVMKRPWHGSRDETLHDITLRDPDSELDDEGLHKYAGGFCYIGDGLPPIKGGTVEVTGTLGTVDSIIEWEHGRMVGTKYEAKETST